VQKLAERADEVGTADLVARAGEAARSLQQHLNLLVAASSQALAFAHKEEEEATKVRAECRCYQWRLWMRTRELLDHIIFVDVAVALYRS
jgi:hypothetical protein